MPKSQRNTILTIITLAGLALSPLTISHYDDYKSKDYLY